MRISFQCLCTVFIIMKTFMHQETVWWTCWFIMLAVLGFVLVIRLEHVMHITTHMWTHYTYRWFQTSTTPWIYRIVCIDYLLCVDMGLFQSKTFSVMIKIYWSCNEVETLQHQACCSCCFKYEINGFILNIVSIIAEW